MNEETKIGEVIEATPTMAETKAFAQKCFGGYKPSEDELKKHSENLKVLVAERHGIKTEEVEDYLKKQRRLRQMRPYRGKIGRNQSCSCGSGLKFKKCHGRFSR